MPLITRVLQPERLNSVILAVLFYEAAPLQIEGRVMQWDDLDESTQCQLIDAMQLVLDRLVSMGVLGVNSPQARDVEPEGEPVEHFSEAPRLAMPGLSEETPQ